MFSNLEPVVNITLFLLFCHYIILFLLFGFYFQLFCQFLYIFLSLPLNALTVLISRSISSDHFCFLGQQVYITWLNKQSFEFIPMCIIVIVYYISLLLNCAGCFFSIILFPYFFLT